MGRHGALQRAASLGHVGKVHQRRVGESQSQVQISQPNVTVQAQHPPAGEGQRRAHAGGEGGLAGASLAGHHGNALSHVRSSLRPNVFTNKLL